MLQIYNFKVEVCVELCTSFLGKKNMKKSLFALMLGGLTIGITEFVIMGLLPDIAADLNITIPQAGHLISSYALGVVIGAPLLVIACRNFAPKKMLLMLAAMLGIFNAFSIIAPNYELLVATRLLSGLPHGAFFGVGAVVASRLASKGKEAQAIAIMFSGLTVANVFGVPLGTYIGHHFSWRYTFVIIAVVGILTFIALSLWMPNLQTEGKVDMKKQLKFFTKTEAWLLIAITAIGFGGLFSWISYIAPLLINISHFSAEYIPYIMVLAGLGMVVGNFAGGRIADRFSPTSTVVTLLLVMAANLTLVYFASANQYISLILVFLTGAIAFAMIAPIQMLVIQTAKGSEMIASATIQASFNIGNALGAFLGGLPIAAGFGYASPNLVGVAMSIAGIFATFLFIQQKKKNPEAVTCS